MTKGQKLKLVTFLIGSVVLLFVVLSAFGGLTWFRRPDRYFVAVPEGVNGLERGSAVSLRGVRVGTVADFELYPRNFQGVRVTLEIDRDVRIARGAHASVNFEGLTGLKSMNIVPGPVGAGWLEPGSSIAYEPSALERLMSEAEGLGTRSVEILKKADGFMDRLNALADAVDHERVERIVAGAERGVIQANGVLDDTRGASRELQALLGEARVELARTASSTRKLFDSAEATLKSADRVFAGAEQTADHLDALVRDSGVELRSITYDLKDASRNIKQFGREVRQQPSRLLFSSPAPERPLP